VIDDFTRATEIDPSDPRPYYNRAIVYEKIEDKARSEADFKRAEELGLPRPGAAAETPRPAPAREACP